ncbi:YneF family protein [[Mycoplasma] testudinis]|uniref:YneF family protein n=1 Tax=[Mycoplasma] testudinis TaxID=33924 RepID=UPI0004884D75|nr:YneF family protein [[Mycoplasma] testudinis]
MELGLALGLGIPLSLIVGAIVGYFISIKIFKKQIKDNPPVTEEQIRNMYTKMGRKPSEAQVRQIMREFKQQDKK